jgi:hypothetical protein
MTCRDVCEISEDGHLFHELQEATGAWIQRESSGKVLSLSWGDHSIHAQAKKNDSGR